MWCGRPSPLKADDLCHADGSLWFPSSDNLHNRQDLPASQTRVSFIFPERCPRECRWVHWCMQLQHNVYNCLFPAWRWHNTLSVYTLGSIYKPISPFKTILLSPWVNECLLRVLLLCVWLFELKCHLSESGWLLSMRHLICQSFRFFLCMIVLYDEYSEVTPQWKWEANGHMNLKRMCKRMCWLCGSLAVWSLGSFLLVWLQQVCSHFGSHSRDRMYLNFVLSIFVSVYFHLLLLFFFFCL